jgi:hypothetical protein
MNSILRHLVVLVALGLAVGATLAQDTTTAPPADTATQADPEETLRDLGYGSFFVEITDWIAQPTGLEYHPASRLDPTNPFDTQFLDVEYGTTNSIIWNVSFVFEKNIGEFGATYWSHEDSQPFQRQRPSQFYFGTIVVNPIYAGVWDDGTADGFTAGTETVTRDLKLYWKRQAFKSKRITGKWWVAARDMDHKRRMEVEYFALVPNLPPIIPPLGSPRPDLDPNPDRGVVTSQFEGRGLGVGFDIVLPISRRKLVMEAGLGLSILRGEITSRFTSQTYYYALLDSANEIERILDPPYDELGQEDPDNPGQPLANRIAQFENPVGLNSDSVGQTATILEAYLGFRWFVWRGLHLTFGYRTQQYDGVGADFVSRTTGSGQNSPINFQTLQQTTRSVNYEGAYFGIAYLF